MRRRLRRVKAFLSIWGLSVLRFKLNKDAVWTYHRAVDGRKGRHGLARGEYPGIFLGGVFGMFHGDRMGRCCSALSAVSEMEFSACGRVVPSTSLMAGKGEDRTWPSRTRNDGQDIQPRPRRIECRSFTSTLFAKRTRRT